MAAPQLPPMPLKVKELASWGEQPETWEEHWQTVCAHFDDELHCVYTNEDARPWKVCDQAWEPSSQWNKWVPCPLGGYKTGHLRADIVSEDPCKRWNAWTLLWALQLQGYKSKIGDIEELADSMEPPVLPKDCHSGNTTESEEEVEEQQQQQQQPGAAGPSNRAAAAAPARVTPAKRRQGDTPSSSQPSQPSQPPARKRGSTFKPPSHLIASQIEHRSKLDNDHAAQAASAPKPAAVSSSPATALQQALSAIQAVGKSVAGLPNACRQQHRYRGSAHSMETGDYAAAGAMAAQDEAQVLSAQQLVKAAVHLGFVNPGQLLAVDRDVLEHTPLPGLDAALLGTATYRGKLQAAAMVVLRLGTVPDRTAEQEAELQAAKEKLMLAPPAPERPQEEEEEENAE